MAKDNIAIRPRDSKHAAVDKVDVSSQATFVPKQTGLALICTCHERLQELDADRLVERMHQTGCKHCLANARSLCMTTQEVLLGNSPMR